MATQHLVSTVVRHEVRTMNPKSSKARSVARPLLMAGTGIAVAVLTHCGGSDQPIVVGNLKPPPYCDAGLCPTDGGQLDEPSCFCPTVDGGSDGGA
jgi:hypothetical protein